MSAGAKSINTETTHGRLVDGGDGLGPGGDARRPGNGTGSEREGNCEQRSKR
jgi:hypothetical protein